jgi:haloacid dehalogenase superfamily, subfamily IA, variant 1 with third motif having Dx(3-4)D or Dx(3-4)E
MLKAVRTLIFDCDGVLFDTNRAKSEAFALTLSAYPAEDVATFIRYHQANGGISRYRKFAYFFSDILRRPSEDGEIEQLLAGFSRHCKSIYQPSTLTPGCQEALKLLSETSRMYVASGGNEEELNLAFRACHLDRYFKRILGSPKTKEDCVEEILSEAPPRPIYFIGDAEADYRAAESAAIPFIFMKRFSENPDTLMERARRQAIPVIDTLSELSDRLIQDEQ